LIAIFAAMSKMIPSSLTANEYYELVTRALADAGDPVRASGQSAYMKHKFVFYGLKAPEWVQMTKAWHAQYGVPSGSALEDLTALCFEDDHREMQYFAVETVQRRIKEQPATFINQLEWLITTKSWWDTVDWLAKLVGIFFQKHPQLIKPTTERWMDSGDIWLQRVSIIFQLFYKQKTDTDLMFRYILRIAHDKEFFLRKGAGWALRQHTRTDAQIVEQFVAMHTDQLSALTKKEALRLLKK
jgi:3-methyladenine DNA glycosylase AlkD